MLEVNLAIKLVKQRFPMSLYAYNTEGIVFFRYVLAQLMLQHYGNVVTTLVPTLSQRQPQHCDNIQM